MSPARRLFRREDGTAAIEFALIGMLLIGVSVGTIEIGRALFLYNELAHAADRAARLVMIAPADASDEDLQSKWEEEQERFPVALPSDLSPTFGPVSGGFREVTLTYPFTPMVSGLTIGSLTMTTVRRVPR